MTWRLVYTERAARDIRALDPGTRSRVGRGLLKLERNPEKGAKRLTQPALGTYRFRIGDYRVIFDVHGADIVILRVGHRSSIYR
ncbi:MAG: type II toxin-antitoxin system RelE family toxin [Thermoanaerobaculia bacterium]